MTGQALSRALRDQLLENVSSGFINSRTSYAYLYEAICNFNKRTHLSTSSQTITIVPGTTAYTLNPDFVAVSLLNDTNEPLVKWTYSGSDTFIYPILESTVTLQDSTATASVAQAYYINDAPAAANVTGTATSTNVQANSEAKLTDTAAAFASVSVGDEIFDTTDGSDGYVVDVIDGTNLYAALFSDSNGPNCYFTSGDAYIIVPQPRYQINITPLPASVATLTIPYIQLPAPVYSPYRNYKLNNQYAGTITKYAAFLYKYRDTQPNFGDAFFKHYELECSRIANEALLAMPNKNNWRVNTSKTNARSRPSGQWTTNR
jgi:hypothetical protein